MKLITTTSIFLLLLCAATPVLAQTSQPATTEKAGEKVRKPKVSQITDERKEQLLAFVAEHHPELKTMLVQLEQKKPKSYQQAINGVNKSVTKIEGLKRRNPKRHGSVLAQWKIDSRINVAAAQLKHKDTKPNREKLKSLIGQLVDLQIDRLKKDREQTRQRLEQIEKRITESEAGRDEAIEKRLQSELPKRKKQPAKKES